MLYNIQYIYFVLISLVAIILTCVDKIYAKREKRRIPEKTLFIIAFLGGSLFMYCTMQVIRHKTKHKRFMLGLPLIMLLQAVLPFTVYILI